jgi:hypothetical protein
VIVLRCTRKLASRLTLTPGAEDLQPTSKLGDWYAGLLNVGHQRFVHCVSERCLLSVVLPAKDVRQLPSRVPGAVASLLTRLGVPGAVVEAEVSAMLPVCVGLTRSRSVVGSLVELGREATFRLSPGAPPTADVELALAAVPCLQLRPHAMPFRTAGELLGVPVADPEWRVLH